MNISIRNVDRVAIKKIDDIAKKKGISRNQFLTRLIKRYTLIPELEMEKKKIEDRYEQIIEKIIPVLQQNTIAMEKIHSIINEIVNEDSNDN